VSTFLCFEILLKKRQHPGIYNQQKSWLSISSAAKSRGAAWLPTLALSRKETVTVELALLACLPPGARPSSVHGLGSQDAGVLGPGRPGARRRAGHRRRNGNGSASRRGVVGIVAAAAASAASARGAPSRAECFVDLKLGGLGDFGVAVDQCDRSAS